MSIAPVGTQPDDAAAWLEVGNIGPGGLTFDPGDPVESFDMRGRPDRELSFSLPAGPFDVFAPDVVVNQPERPRRVAYSYDTPALPPKPVKRRRLTGKAYRIARRQFRRQVQAWERAGRPMITRQLGFHAEVVAADPSADGSSLSLTMRVVPPPGLASDSHWFQHVSDGPVPQGVLAWTP